jgi:hypothetical protein
MVCKSHKFTSYSSKGWVAQGQGTRRFSVWWRPVFIRGALLLSSDGGKVWETSNQIDWEETLTSARSCHVRVLCAEKAKPWHWHEGGKQGSASSKEETEAVEIDLCTSTALSKGPLADRHRSSQGEARFSKVPCRENRACWHRIVCSK